LTGAKKPKSYSIKFKATMVELGMGHAFSESDTTRTEVIGGYRYADQDVDANISFPPPPIGPGQYW
jgi:hypothetical protein